MALRAAIGKAGVANGRYERIIVRSGRIRCLNDTLFSTLTEARTAITSWKEDYNHHRTTLGPRQHAAGRVRNEIHAGKTGLMRPEMKPRTLPQAGGDLGLKSGSMLMADGDTAPIDWLASSIEDRKALYRVVKPALDARRWDIAMLYAEVLGITAIGKGSIDNFRSGRLGRKQALQIYRWLRRSDPNRCDTLDFELASSQRPEEVQGSAWARLLQRESRFEHLDILPAPQDRLTIVSFAKATPIAERKLKLGDRFLFRLQSPLTGRVAAMQGYRGRWYPLPLAETENSCPITKGEQYLPSGARGGVEPLDEKEDAGLHQFLFVAADDSSAITEAAAFPEATVIPRDRLDCFAAKFLAHDRSGRFAYRINALISI